MDFQISRSGRPIEPVMSQEEGDAELRKCYLEDHWRELRRHDGDIVMFVGKKDEKQRTQAPKGLCIDGELSPEYEKFFRRYVVPYKVNIDSQYYWSDARKRRKEAQKNLGIDDPLYVALRDEEGNWISGYIDREDILRNDKTALIFEGAAARKEGNESLYEAKRIAYLILTPEDSIKRQAI